MASFKFIEWLLTWFIDNESFVFEWDEGNQEKNKDKHGVEVKEIEEERFGIIGPSKKDKILHIVFTIREDRVRPISARPAHKKEKELYEKGLC